MAPASSPANIPSLPEAWIEKTDAAVTETEVPIEDAQDPQVIEVPAQAAETAKSTPTPPAETTESANAKTDTREETEGAAENASGTETVDPGAMRGGMTMIGRRDVTEISSMTAEVEVDAGVIVEIAI